MSIISYMNPIWFGCVIVKIEEMQRLQNRIIKSIENKTRLTPTSSLYVDKLDISGFTVFQIIQTIHKIENDVCINQVRQYAHFSAQLCKL